MEEAVQLGKMQPERILSFKEMTRTFVKKVTAGSPLLF